MKQKIVIIAVLLLGVGSVAAQSFSLRFGGAFPMGKYADATADYANENLRWGLLDKSNKGGAGIGFTAGVQAKFDVKSVPGLGVIASVDGMFNSLNSDVNDYFSDQVDDMEDEYDEYSVTLPKYINLPVMVGLGYTHTLGGTLAAYGEAALGLNVRLVTPATMSYVYGTTERVETLSYDAATSFAFRIGAGLVFGGKYTLGVDYYALGESKVTGSWSTEENGKSSNSTENIKGGKIAPTNLTLRFGINF